MDQIGPDLLKTGRRVSRSRITRSEAILLCAAAPAVVVSPFLLGGMVWWSQVTIACLQALVFLVAVLPYAGIPDWKERMGRILRFPPFWVGGLFVLYVIIQACNPSMEQVYLDSKRHFVAERKPEFFIAWLPQSIESNFYIMNPWRMVLFWTGAWLFTSAVWSGLKSRSAWLALGWIALVAGTVLGLASITHHLSTNEDLFWISKYKRNIGAFGPFVYRNQGGAFLYLSSAIGLLMFLRFLKRGHMRSGLPWVALFLSVICLLGVALSTSRGAWIGGGGILVVFLLLVPFSIPWSNGFSLGALVGSGLVVAAIIGVGVWATTTLDFSEMKTKWKKMTTSEEVSIGARFTLSEITWSMFEDKPWTGWGAGSYYYRFPLYALSYPEIYFAGTPKWKHYGSKTHNYKQAHNDLFQFLAEYGIIGCSLLTVCFAWWFLLPMLNRTLSVEWLMGVASCLLFVCHNVGDFLLQNSILMQSFLILLLLTGGLISALPHRQKAN